MYASWTVKHKPSSLSEVVGNAEAIQKLSKWVNSWETGIPKKRAVFLYGPPGVGKTVSVEALANDSGMELVERNGRGGGKVRGSGLSVRHSAWS